MVLAAKLAMLLTLFLYAALIPFYVAGILLTAFLGIKNVEPVKPLLDGLMVLLKSIDKRLTATKNHK